MKLSKTSEKTIALIDLNFYWTEYEIKKIINGYKRKLNIKELSKLVKRSVDEVAILIIHLGREGKI